MSPQDLFAVAVRAMALWLIVIAVMSLLGIVTGPFAQLIVGVLLLVLARPVCRICGPS